jgi:spore germination cell wall hydrolase CwlJ-like protein
MNLDDFSSSTWTDSVKAAAAAYFSMEADLTLGATMYHATSITPQWDYSKLKQTAVIGNHVFYLEFK